MNSLMSKPVGLRVGMVVVVVWVYSRGFRIDKARDKNSNRAGAFLYVLSIAAQQGGWSSNVRSEDVKLFRRRLVLAWTALNPIRRLEALSAFDWNLFLPLSSHNTPGDYFERIRVLRRRRTLDEIACLIIQMPERSSTLPATSSRPCHRLSADMGPLA